MAASTAATSTWMPGTNVWVVLTGPSIDNLTASAKTVPSPGSSPVVPGRGACGSRAKGGSSVSVQASPPQRSQAKVPIVGSHASRDPTTGRSGGTRSGMSQRIACRLRHLVKRSHSPGSPWTRDSQAVATPDDDCLATYLTAAVESLHETQGGSLGSPVALAAKTTQTSFRSFGRVDHTSRRRPVRSSFVGQTTQPGGGRRAGPRVDVPASASDSRRSPG